MYKRRHILPDTRAVCQQLLDNMCLARTRFVCESCLDVLFRVNCIKNPFRPVHSAHIDALVAAAAAATPGDLVATTFSVPVGSAAPAFPPADAHCSEDCTPGAPIIWKSEMEWWGQGPAEFIEGRWAGCSELRPCIRLGGRVYRSTLRVERVNAVQRNGQIVDPTSPEPNWFSDDSSDSTIAPEEAIARDNGDNGPVGFPFVFGAGIHPGFSATMTTGRWSL